MYYTKQRKAIFSVLQGNTCHPTAEEVYRQVKRALPRVSLATVYRNLKLLAQEGLILELVFPDEPNRYDPCTEAHHHFRCDRCGRICDIDAGDVRINQAVEHKGFTVRTQQIFFYGICPECKSKN